MKLQSVQIIESSIILLIYVVVYFINKKVINDTLKKAPLERSRRKIIIKVLQLFTTLIALILLSGVWGFNQNEIAAFASTLLTALGIAFVAQWSLLSHITSSIIIFFNHPLKLGDKLRVLDKDCPFEGEITELGYFFVYLRNEDGEIISIPNAQILQKSIVISSQKTQ